MMLKLTTNSLAVAIKLERFTAQMGLIDQFFYVYMHTSAFFLKSALSKDVHHANIVLVVDNLLFVSH